MGSSLDFTSEGAEIFADLTEQVAQLSDPVTGEPGRMAIVLDGQLESAPSVRQKIDGGSGTKETLISVKRRCSPIFE